MTFCQANFLTKENEMPSHKSKLVRAYNLLKVIEGLRNTYGTIGSIESIGSEEMRVKIALLQDEEIVLTGDFFTFPYPVIGTNKKAIPVTEGDLVLFGKVSPSKYEIMSALPLSYIL